MLYRLWNIRVVLSALFGCSIEADSYFIPWWCPFFQAAKPLKSLIFDSLFIVASFEICVSAPFCYCLYWISIGTDILRGLVVKSTFSLIIIMVYSPTAKFCDFSLETYWYRLIYFRISFPQYSKIITLYILGEMSSLLELYLRQEDIEVWWWLRYSK